MKKAGCAIVLVTLTASVTLCTFEMTRANDRSSAYQPASQLTDNQHNYFHVVGFQKGVPRLVTLTELEPDGTHPEIETFYIPAAKRAEVLESVRGNLPRDIQVITKLEIVRDDPATRRQQVSLSLDSDEFHYAPIYDVDDARVTPVSYADVTRRETWQGMMAGLKVFAVVMISGLVVLIVSTVLLRKKP